MASAARIYQDPVEVDHRLGQLGLRRGWLVEAVQQGELQRRLATNLDPRPTGGYNAWARTVRIIRELLVAEGWHPTDEGGIPTIVDADEIVFVIVSSGDRRTGRTDDGADPKTKNVKGEATARVVRANTLMSTLYEEDEVGPSTWVLLVSSNRDGLFAELSCPGDITADGRIAGWSERIVLGKIDLGDAPVVAVPVEPEAPVDVPVTRRSS